MARNVLRPMIQEVQTSRRLFLERHRYLPGSDAAQVLESQARDLVREIPPIPGDEMLTFWVLSEVEATASSLALVGEVERTEALLLDVQDAYQRLVDQYPDNLVLRDRLEKAKGKKDKATSTPPGLSGGGPPGLGGGGPPGLGGGLPPGLGGP